MQIRHLLAAHAAQPLFLRSFLACWQAPVTQPSAAEIPEGSAAKPAFFSLRFDRSEVQAKAERIYGLLKERGFPVRLVKAMPGDDFGQLVTGYLGEIKTERGMLLCVCTETYGEKTESEFSTYDELWFAASHGLKVVPLKMEATYPPKPQGEKAKALIFKVFSRIWRTSTAQTRRSRRSLSRSRRCYWHKEMVRADSVQRREHDS